MNVLQKIGLTIAWLGLLTNAHAQNYVSLSDQQVRLDNGMIVREIKLQQDSFYTSVLQHHADTANSVLDSPDFAMRVNDQLITGFSGWRWAGSSKLSDTTGGQGVAIRLRSLDGTMGLLINYMLYPDYPLVRKWLTITNHGQDDLKIESLDVEALHTRYSHISSVVHHNYARMKHIGRFVGNWHDPVVVLHNLTERRGMALGNESIGILKRTAYHTANNNVSIGLTHPDQSYPFRKWLAPGESWQSPKSFIALYVERDDAFQVIDDEVNEFFIKHLRPRITQLTEKPTFVYNTWNPFRTFVNDSLIRDVAQAAAECGIEEFIIDDGWQVNAHGQSSIRGWGENYGDWFVDRQKFPDGLKPVFDDIKSLGMKPGLWVSIASATKDAQVYQEHPEWFVKAADGQLANLHYESETDDGFYSAAFGTAWYDYIKTVILRLVQEHGLAYAKLDLAVVTSPYINTDSISGCYASDHPHHRDHPESFLVIYRRVLQLFDELHEQAPELFIDCTFETAGKLQLMDYAIAHHAEGNWLSNFEEASPTGPLRVRQMAWWRSPALPAASLVIGNLPMNDPDFVFGLQSLIGTLPIVLGDPRQIPQERRKVIRQWSQWMRQMQDTYDYMSYRKDLPGFGEPRQGHWDGWQRINFQTQAGGIFGVFRQGALESSRTVFLKDLDPKADYVVRLAPEGQKVHRSTGHDLMTKGLKVTLPELYSAGIYEVAKQ